MKLKRRFYALICLGLLLLLGQGLSPATAQTYYFRVPELRMQVYVQPDASVRIVYDITFENLGSPIDIVDIGAPHEDYAISTMRASIDGVGLSDIRKSEYIDVGVEVHLHDQAIPYGETGTLHFEFTMPDMVYQDTTRKEYASLQITPTWFDGQSVAGSTDLMLAVHMPEGVNADDVLYQKEPFTQKAIYEGRAVAVWNWPDASATRAYLVGVSFPKTGMDRVIEMTTWQLILKWLDDNPEARLFLGLITAVLFSIAFFRFTGGTGCSVYVFLLAGLVLLLVLSPALQIFSIPLMILLVIINEVSLKKRRKTYLPPVAEVEGGGIKRGLTAPEAAVLLEMPFNKVLTLVIFGLLAKDIVRQVEAEPLKVKLNDAYRTRNNSTLDNAKKRLAFRRSVAQQKKTVVHSYEEPFLFLLERDEDKPVHKIDFGGAMRALIMQTTAKMKGFDLSDTQDYYKRVIDRAWKQAQSIGEIPEREEYLDKYLPWVVMNESYPTVMTWGGHHYRPIWWRRSYVGPVLAGGSLRGGAKSSSGRPSAGGRTTLGDVGSSFAGWAEATMGGMASAVLPSSLKLPNASGGVIDLSGVDKVTGDVFDALAKASASSSKGGGRSGGGCACACAGCACACACAGGGR
ncbi:MAG: hypothetical protein JXB35_01300 [Anaerolineae bacterium]|nr:hypothetical protein [Anaerolineae bacterium]